MKDPAKEKEQLVKKEENLEAMISSKTSEDLVSQTGNDQLCQKPLIDNVK